MSNQLFFDKRYQLMIKCFLFLKEVCCMKNLKIIKVNLSNAYKIIKRNIYNCQTITFELHTERYHHNADFESIDKIVNNGILPLKEKMELEGQKMTISEELKFSEEYHVNGINSVSLARMDIDYNLISKNEWIYEPFTTDKADIIISNKVKAYRNSRNYANEYLSNGKISPEYFRTIDVRVLKSLYDQTIIYKDNSKEGRLSKAIEYYNSLRLIAATILESKLNIYFREMSYENITLDLNKTSELPILVLEK